MKLYCIDTFRNVLSDIAFWLHYFVTFRLVESVDLCWTQTTQHKLKHRMECAVRGVLSSTLIRRCFVQLLVSVKQLGCLPWGGRHRRGNSHCNWHFKKRCCKCGVEKQPWPISSVSLCAPREFHLYLLLQKTTIFISDSCWMGISVFQGDDQLERNYTTVTATRSQNAEWVHLHAGRQCDAFKEWARSRAEGRRGRLRFHFYWSLSCRGFQRPLEVQWGIVMKTMPSVNWRYFQRTSSTINPTLAMILQAAAALCSSLVFNIFPNTKKEGMAG